MLTIIGRRVVVCRSPAVAGRPIAGTACVPPAGRAAGKGGTRHERGNLVI